MFCKHCGKPVGDTDRFCSACGGALCASTPQPEKTGETEQPQVATAATEPSSPAIEETPILKEQTPPETEQESPSPAPDVYLPHTDTEQKNSESFTPSEEEQSHHASVILRYGIMSLAFSCTLILGIVGLILGIVTHTKVNDYTELYGPVTWKSRVGKSLGRAGLIAGIVGTAYFALYFFMLIMILLLP